MCESRVGGERLTDRPTHCGWVGDRRIHTLTPLTPSHSPTATVLTDCLITHSLTERFPMYISHVQYVNCITSSLL